MKDVQNQQGPYHLDIDKVGVRDIRYPIVVLDKAKGTQHTVATCNMFVDLPRRFKGTHMSRFIEILNEYRERIDIRYVNEILHKMKERLSAQSAHIDISFPYFIEKEAPVSKELGLMEYTCSYHGFSGDDDEFVVGIRVPVTTLCPCSREIADVGAHNQRGYVLVRLLYEKFFWIEDIIALVEGSASAGVYSLLKRVDEKYLTERAYENPMFVEDVVRKTANGLKELGLFRWFSVSAENIESIHNHSAYAYLEWGSRPRCV